jgi:DUF971 family protein
MSTSNPATIDISKSTGVTIEWTDGHRSHYELQYLRDRCPCANCAKSERKAPAALPMFKPRAKIEDVEQVGRYALRFFWNDGHSTGLYSYEQLREICPCPECARASQQSQ